MCGIAGFLNDRRFEGHVDRLLTRMGDALRHRGPDDGGRYHDAGVALAHRRLSVIDTSIAGRQPMSSPSGRYQIVYNGEIYNFNALREELEHEGYSFAGHSDTEVLIAQFERFGLDCLKKLNGMFAFAIWDTRDATLFLVRDRLGKKPLYYYDKDGCFAFASELCALRELPQIDLSLRADAIRDYFAHQYVPDPKTVYRHVHKLPPAHWLRVDNTGLRSEAYWDIDFNRIDRRSPEALREELVELLDDSVRSRMISDVPIGAFLSGGVDSSGVVALMARASRTAVSTCTIGFDSRDHDELDHARAVATHLGTDHHEFVVKERIVARVPQIAALLDEPFADPSFVPTWFVSRMARQHVTVALAGDGGDENFAGYTKYEIDARENRWRARLPESARRDLLPLCRRLLDPVDIRPVRRVRSMLESLAAEPGAAFAISNRFFDPEVWCRIVRPSFAQELGDYDPSSITTDKYRQADTDEHLSRILYADLKTYLPGDILVKVDRMSMTHSLEIRAPLLDYRIVEFAARLPANLKLDRRGGKRLLKESFAALLQESTLRRRKMGFSVPLARWLRQDLSASVADHLLTPTSGLTDFFELAEVRKLWEHHQRGRDDFTQEIWSLYLFAIWLRHHGPDRAVFP